MSARPSRLSVRSSVAVLALAAAGVAAAAAPLAAQGRVQVRDSLVFRRDSMIVRLMPQDADGLLRQVMQLREKESKLVGELRAVAPGDVLTRRRLTEELQLVARESFSLMSAIEASCAAERSAPEGFLGISFMSDLVEAPDGRVRFQRARVETVEPGSPAAAAGIAAGDLLIAIAGRDFQTDRPDISDLLTIGRRVPVRTMREGRMREATLTVAPRPATFAQSCGQFERALQPLRLAGPPRMAMEGALPRRPAPGDSMRATVTTRGGAEEMRIFVFSPSAGGVRSIGFFAGAEFRTLDDEWREVLGLKAGTTGVIVSEVAPGSASAAAGLRKGDVVTAVGKSPATSPEVLVRLLSVTEGSDATLAVTRGKDRKTLTLRVGPR